MTGVFPQRQGEQGIILKHIDGTLPLISSSENDNCDDLKVVENSKHNKTYQKELAELMRLSTERRHKWSSRVEFILASLSYLIGYDSTFTFLSNFCFAGSISILPFIVILLIYGLPVMYLEMSVGQFSSLDPPLLFRRISPAMAAIGYVSWIVSFLSLMSSQGVLLMSFEVLTNSLSALMENQLNSESCHKYYSTDDCVELSRLDCEANRMVPMNGGCVRYAQTSKVQFEYMQNMSHTQYFNYRKSATYQLVLLKLYSVYDLKTTDVPCLSMLVWLSICWLVTALIAKRGISFVCKVSYLNAIGFVLITALVFICGVILDGGVYGMSNFFTFDWSHVYDPAMWIGTFLYFATCFKLGQGGLIILGSYNDFHENIFYEVAIISVAAFVCPFIMVSALTPLYTAFFKVLANGKEFRREEYENAIGTFSGGDGMVVTTAALSLIPELNAGVTTIFACLIILMVMGNQMMRLVLLVSSLRENFFMCHQKFYLETAIYLFCTVGYFLTFYFLTAYGGMNYYICYVLLIPLGCAAVSFYETVTIAYFYGSKKFFSNIHAMLFGKRKKDRNEGLWRYVPHFSAYVMFCWGFITPFFTGVSFVTTCTFMMVYIHRYSDGVVSAAHTILWIFTGVVLTVPAYALFRMSQCMWKKRPVTMLFRPNLMLWGPRFKRHRVLAQTAEERWGV